MVNERQQSELCSLLHSVTPSLPRAAMSPVLRKDLGQKPQQKYPYQDRHIGNKHGGIRSHCSSRSLQPGDSSVPT